MKKRKKQGFDHMEIIESLLHQIKGKDAQIDVLVDEVKSLEKTVSRQSDEIATLRRALYGTSSERSVAISNDDESEGEKDNEDNNDDGDSCDPSEDAEKANSSEVGDCSESKVILKNINLQFCK